ncbi:hypothetical protein ACO2Q0_15075 [Phenylobacterium sp. VNQ135]|uniref:hypothetical protein n=1 Tax=Phenylobacterium sp. VNQ135 TaxID=3400922 RepID=UPI003C05D5D2
MIDGLRQTDFIGAYHFADVIANVLEDPLDYMAGGLEAFCDGELAHSFLPPFPRVSALHRFAAFIIDTLFYEADVDGFSVPDESTLERRSLLVEMGLGCDDSLWVERALRRHGIPSVS